MLKKVLISAVIAGCAISAVSFAAPQDQQRNRQQLEQNRQQLEQNRQQLETRGGRAGRTAAAVNAASNQGSTGTSVVIGQVASEAID